MCPCVCEVQWGPAASLLGLLHTALPNCLSSSPRCLAEHLTYLWLPASVWVWVELVWLGLHGSGWVWVGLARPGLGWVGLVWLGLGWVGLGWSG